MTDSQSQSRLHDSSSGYGWISIALHWLTAILVIVLLLLGSSIETAEPEQRSCMLVSGPLMVWAGGSAIGVYDWFEIPGPIGAHPGLADLLLSVHSSAAIIITIGVVLHLGGVYKHAAFDQDGTFGKMLMPPAKRTRDSA